MSNNSTRQNTNDLKGTWGGDHISMEVTDSGAEIEYDCAHGSVTETNLMMDRMTNRPRGFGFVTMSTDAEAQAAYERATLLSPASELQRRYPEVAKLAAKYHAAMAPGEADPE